MTFRKGSTRYKILEGLRELKMDAVLKFMKLYGKSDPNNHPTATQAVHEVIAGIPRNRLAEALVVVERSAKKVDRAAIQNAAKHYIDKINDESLDYDKNRHAILEATAKILPPDKRDIVNTVEAMGKMSREIILSGIDTVIAGKAKNAYAKWDVTPEEIEGFMSAMREGVDPLTGLKVSKVGFFGNPPNSDLVYREYNREPVVTTVAPEKDFYEYRGYRQALLEEVYALAGLTRDTGWFEEDTPGIPKEKFAKAIEFVYMLPEKEGNGYLPHGIKASPDGTVTFWWKHGKKTVTFSITTFANSSWQLIYRGSVRQDHDDRFLMLQPGAIEYLIIALKKMYS